VQLEQWQGGTTIVSFDEFTVSQKEACGIFKQSRPAYRNPEKSKDPSEQLAPSCYNSCIFWYKFAGILCKFWNMDVSIRRCSPWNRFGNFFIQQVEVSFVGQMDLGAEEF
jgi:hypothetical protein